MTRAAGCHFRHGETLRPNSFSCGLGIVSLTVSYVQPISASIKPFHAALIDFKSASGREFGLYCRIYIQS